ncbi:hypothetical protein FKM82_017754 [Ascaphus truei]
MPLHEKMHHVTQINRMLLQDSFSRPGFSTDDRNTISNSLAVDLMFTSPFTDFDLNTTKWETDQNNNLVEGPRSGLGNIFSAKGHFDI